MASQPCALEIAGGRSTPAFFGCRDLLRRQPPKFLSLSANTPCRGNLCAAAAAMMPAPAPAHASSNLPSLLDPVFSFTQRRRAEHQRITPEMLDELMRDSVEEIVRNVRKAPFLMLVFLEEGGGDAKGRTKPKWCLCSSPPRLMLESMAATPECWPGIKKRWEQESCIPDGLILVEELEMEEKGGEAAAAARRNRGEESQRWGVVIEGRGMECSACYILNTCRVVSPVGYCTHYYLVRAQSYGDPIGVQVMNAWLQR